MRIDTFTLFSTILLSTSLVGCQSIIKSNSTDVATEKKMRWNKDGQVFQEPNDTLLGKNESRVVFFRDPDVARKDVPVYIGIGSEKMFQTSLKEGHYSSVVVCSGPQQINSANIQNSSENVISYSKNYNLTPQKTTYIKVNLSSNNQLSAQQVNVEEAIPQLENIMRQSYQISRVSTTCDTKYEKIEYMVNFDFDTNVINTRYSKFEDLVSFINLYPDNNIILEGHTDSKGSPEYNLQLSKSRADKVKNILVNNYGIDAYKLRTVGYGETRPIDTNETDLGRLNNRRVVAVISP